VFPVKNFEKNQILSSILHVLAIHSFTYEKNEV